MKVGEKIKQIRKDKGLQQKAVALEVGLDQSNYNKVENGGREPSLEVLQKLSAILGVSIDELLKVFASDVEQVDEDEDDDDEDEDDDEGPFAG